MDKRNILNIERSALVAEPLLAGEKAFRLRQVYEWLHVKTVSDFSAMTNVGKALRSRLDSAYYIGGLTEVTKQVSADGTEKYLFELPDGHRIESVLMRYKHGNSICISTQVGCRMGCRFCASTLDGLARNLTAGEMLAQVYGVQHGIGERISNIVLMGQGEPMDNIDEVLKFLRMITDEYGLHISRRNITVSTCGLVPAIRTLADADMGVTLAISLHAPDDVLRRTMMPVANRYSIDEILAAARYYFEKTGRRVSFEYALVEGVNDDPGQARTLAQKLKGLSCHVNLIPVNPVTERDYKRPRQERIAAFRTVLERQSLNVTVRREMGTDIDGACGQLRRRMKPADV
ncbi:MAG: 23S rRNA (adenine(2503)-C(2))-methyltransferase RlmN [Eubacteriales bacterium]|nr:23S rRNA (adenine(2503)-C(2))-methyltransferase RlmN [Eubacteriales bacterium]